MLAVYHLVFNMKQNLQKSIESLISQLIIVSYLLDLMGAPYREVNSKVTTGPNTQTRRKRWAKIIQKNQIVKLNILKVKASLNKFSRGKLVIKVEFQTLKLK